MLRIAVFASGSGSNLQALLDHFNGTHDRGARVAIVASDRENARALDRARASVVDTRVINVAGRPPADVAADMLALLSDHAIDVIALAGYLRLVPGDVVRAFRGRIVNVHPALLPAFGGPGMYGMRVHRAVIAAGCRVTGATVHHVDERYDEGRPIAQWPVPVLSGDDPETLALRVLRFEHVLYPLALESLVRDVAGATRAPSTPAVNSYAGGYALVGAFDRDAVAGMIRGVLGV